MDDFIAEKERRECKSVKKGSVRHPFEPLRIG